jgi:hypothetical protein
MYIAKKRRSFLGISIILIGNPSWAEPAKTLSSKKSASNRRRLNYCISISFPNTGGITVSSNTLIASAIRLNTLSC